MVSSVPAPASPLFIAARDLAHQMGISTRTLYRWEHDPHDPLVPARPGGWERAYRVADVQAWFDRRKTYPQNSPPSRNPNLPAAQRKGLKVRRRLAKASQ
jgi:predicted DNA-binding transcriptional regulator AlpA